MIFVTVCPGHLPSYCRRFQDNWTLLKLSNKNILMDLSYVNLDCLRLTNVFLGNWFQHHKIMLIENYEKVYRGLYRTALMPCKVEFMILFKR